MGGGVATEGSSVAVTRETDRLMEAIEKLQEEVAAALNKQVEAGVLPADAPVRVVWDEDAIFAVPEPPVVKVNITGKMLIPPL